MYNVQTNKHEFVYRKLYNIFSRFQLNEKLNLRQHSFYKTHKKKKNNKTKGRRTGCFKQKCLQIYSAFKQETLKK